MFLHILSVSCRLKHEYDIIDICHPDSDERPGAAAAHVRAAAADVRRALRGDGAEGGAAPAPARAPHVVAQPVARYPHTQARPEHTPATRPRRRPLHTKGRKRGKGVANTLALIFLVNLNNSLGWS